VLGILDIRSNAAPDVRVVNIGSRVPGPKAIRKVSVLLNDLAEFYVAVE
jgi:hypothetical protein